VLKSTAIDQLRVHTTLIGLQEERHCCVVLAPGRSVTWCCGNTLHMLMSWDVTLRITCLMPVSLLCC
jgi:hypothetical protein